MTVAAERHKLFFESGEAFCAAWHYPGQNGACVIMAPGGAVTKEAGTDPFAPRFQRAGFSVLAFEFRRTGESGGEPRQILNVGEQLADWDAAIDRARRLPEVDPARLAIWGFSLSGGHVFVMAARHRELMAAIAQSPFADGRAASVSALRHQTPLAAARFAARGVRDTARGLLGREPLLVPLDGKPGSVAMLTTPDADGNSALNPGNAYPDWQQEVAARSALRLGSYRPGRHASRIECPLLVVVCEEDCAAPAKAALGAAGRARQAETVRLPGGHYAPFLDAHEAAVKAELAFLERHLTAAGAGAPSRPDLASR